MIDPTLPALARIRSSLRSTGRYGPSPFLVGHYGGAGEIAQGFCRTAAVHGGVYILGRRVVSSEFHESADMRGSLALRIEDFPETMTCDLMIASPTLLPSNLRTRAKVVEVEGFLPPTQAIARGILILDGVSIFESLGIETSDDVQVDEDEAERPSNRPADTSIVVFPPSSVSGGRGDVAVTAYIIGEGSMATPRGKCK
jgi:Rab proteins geranylgeranyltransferase component A